MMITKIFDREKDNEQKSAKRPTGGTVTVKGLMVSHNCDRWDNVYTELKYFCSYKNIN